MLSFSYSALFAVLWLSILFYYNAAMIKLSLETRLRWRKMLRASAIMAVWLIAQWVLTDSGFYMDMSLPPRLPLFMILPLFLFMIVFFRRNWKSQLIDQIPLHIPIAYQSFRAVIETLFYYSFLAGILPKEVTFSGYNYDVLLGLSAVPVALYTAFSKNLSRQFLVIWNYLGLIIVGFAAFIFITSFYFPQVWGYEVSQISTEFAQYPYLILPAFFMPSAVFVHVLSIIQLRR